MITFAGNEKKTQQVAITGESKSLVGSIKLTPVWHGWQNGRMWIWFPLVMESEVFGKTLPHEWIKVYPRIIQWSDGKYYSFRGTHSAIPEYRIKGDNTVYYREILVEQGEKVEWSSLS